MTDPCSGADRSHALPDPHDDPVRWDEIVSAVLGPTRCWS
jgi:hypothetical protein